VDGFPPRGRGRGKTREGNFRGNNWKNSLVAFKPRGEVNIKSEQALGKIFGGKGT